MNPPSFVWLIVLLQAAAPLIYLAGRLLSRPAARWAGLAALALAWLPLWEAARARAGQASINYVFGAVALRFDGLSLLLAALALGLGTLVALFSFSYVAGSPGEEKFFALLSAMVGLMIGLGCAGDLFNLWVWFEALSVSSYLLVTFYAQRPASLEAGVKYVTQSAAGSVLVLIGVALVLGQTGELDLERIHAQARSAPALWAAGALLVAGFGVKAALVPLHTWLPDAHSQAPSGISAMLSGVVISAGLIALLRALAALSGVSGAWGALLLGFGALNMLAGNLLALRQSQIKRLLAYSSLSHMGYMLLGLGIAVQAGQAGGAQSGLFHLLNHGLLKGLAFLAAGALLYALRGGPGAHQPLTLDDLAGAARRYPLAALAFSLAVLGLAGLPPLACFMSKWQIFVAGFATGVPAIEALVLFAALNSVLSLAYYAPLVNAVYRLQPSNSVARGLLLPRTMQAPLALMTVAIVVLGIWPDLANGLTRPAGAALLAALGG